jgi:hypothetical protein
MTNDQLRVIRRRLRDGHQKIFDLQGEAITALREALEGIAKTHDEIAELMQADNDLEDLADDR